jgi:hypothetical protein
MSKRETNKRYRAKQNARGILRIEVCLPVDVVEKLDKLCADQEISPATWMKNAIEKA